MSSTAQVGVEYSFTDTDVNVESKLTRFCNILETCLHSFDNGATDIAHLAYARSSSGYGLDEKVPYSADDKTDNPVSLYSAAKKNKECLAHVYSKIYNIPSIGLCFSWCMVLLPAWTWRTSTSPIS